MKNWAIISQETNIVLNTIVWDGVSEYNPGNNLSLIQLPEGISYGIGWTWDGEKFIDPNPPVAEEPTTPTE